jgi:solute carrier family 13 (sodium-dependent dicarboxylate transporter), member 2/3/5
MVVFALTVAGWVFREPKAIGGVVVPGLTDWIPGLQDATIAMAAALLLFLLPVDARRGEFVMDWRTARRLPWGVLLLFGGGLSLARAFEVSGLTRAIGELVTGMAGLPGWLLIAAVCATFIALSELASNTAIAAMAMPVLVAAATGMGQDPLLFMAAAALASSAAFMLPVATPPNAIVFGSGYLAIGQMMRAGVWLNLVSLLLMTLAATVLVPAVFG